MHGCEKFVLERNLFFFKRPALYETADAGEGAGDGNG